MQQSFLTICSALYNLLMLKEKSSNR